MGTFSGNWTMGGEWYPHVGTDFLKDGDWYSPVVGTNPLTIAFIIGENWYSLGRGSMSFKDGYGYSPLQDLILFRVETDTLQGGSNILQGWRLIFISGEDWHSPRWEPMPSRIGTLPCRIWHSSGQRLIILRMGTDNLRGRDWYSN